MKPVVWFVVAVANLALWLWLARWLEPRARRWVERRYAVTIGRIRRGGWRVIGPNAGSWFRRRRLELIQPALFMGLLVVWAGAILLIVWAMGGVRSTP